MGKKVKKKPRSGAKDKRVQNGHSKTISEDSITDNSTPTEQITVIKDKRICPHLIKGIDFEKVSVKLKSSEPSRCEDCRDGVIDRRASKGKGKPGSKKKAAGVESTIWVCLECGHFSCGGGPGLPNTPQSHAVRHAKQHRHPLAIKYENPQLRWCFPCNNVIPVEKSDTLHDIVKLIKGRSSVDPTVDVEDVWFGSGSVLSGVKSETSVDFISGGYKVKGLINLGNTCFFNSVMQNLLAMDKLRNYFLKLEGTLGPLTSSLKKLYIETSPDSSLKGVVNPRTFFGCVCAKASQFRGFQQHDSHELLRCLLDALSNEESSARKQIKCLTEDEKKSSHELTFVDSVFGGKLSSIVCCMECEHSSIVYEPFLDLSLPVPTKKGPGLGSGSGLGPKKFQPVSRSKKAKLPHVRSARALSKFNRNLNNQPAQRGKSSSSAQSVGPTQDSVAISESNETEEDVNHVVVATQNVGPTEDDCTWMDFCEFDDDNNTVSQIGESSVTENTSETVIENTQNVGSTHETEEIVSEENNLVLVDESIVSENTILNETNTEIDTDITESDCNGMGPHLISEETRIKDDVINLEESSESSSNKKLWEDEISMEVQDSSTIILLPYKNDDSSINELSKGEEDEASSSVVLGCDPDSSEFDGLGGLFDEPEPEPETSTKPSVSSESDPDEVDNSDAPVSIQSCLSHFIKPELLLRDEHAWQCESCSKVVLEEKLKKKKIVKSKSDIIINEQNENNSSLCNGVIEGEVIEKVASESVNNEENHDNNESVELVGPSQLEEGSDDEVAETENVKVKRDATKRILIDRAPPILTIHLKRFSQDSRGRLSKLNGHVGFKETINLKPYMNPRCVEKDGYIYRLVGVVEHLGTMRGGHYVAYVRGGAKRVKSENGNEDYVWYHASDAYVREATLEEVLRCEAYILFYEQI